jgi:hypothetical protein
MMPRTLSRRDPERGTAAAGRRGEFAALAAAKRFVERDH